MEQVKNIIVSFLNGLIALFKVFQKYYHQADDAGYLDDLNAAVAEANAAAGN